jgi:hypothetical protein
LAEAEDHNPEILEDCPACQGRGTICEEAGGVASLDDCRECSGVGTTFNVVRYFSNDSPAKSARADADGWIQCPTCGFRFSTKDPDRWSGWRHMRCGQRISVEESGDGRS